MKDINVAIEKYRELILEAERYIWKNPETGYKEYKTSNYMAEKFKELGYELTMADGIPGFYTRIETGREGPEVLVLGELDSVICKSHPESDPETGAVHACGHNAQCAALLGIAAALKEPSVLAKLSGSVRLCAVPAEEFLEIEYRQKLCDAGKIKYLGGKVEFLSRGYFDGADIAILVHTDSKFSVLGGSVGFIAKEVIYKGTAAHAGSSPDKGRNALYAATCGINAVNAIRETFRDFDHIRVHPIITDGGDMVNAIPERVRIESYVRGKTFDAIKSANTAVNRALTGAALSLGTNIEIIDVPGYSPLVNAPDLIEVTKEAAELAIPEEEFKVKENYSTGSTDMGDLSCVMPTVQPYAGGDIGHGHGNDYYIADPDAACVKSAKLQLAMLLILLGNGAVRAKNVVENFKPRFATKEEFLSYLDSLNSFGDRIIYREDGSAEIKA